jgi:DNA-binding NarL/FixJ family response regulator
MKQPTTDWTPRQRQIMRLLIKGARTKEAASELGVSEHTVRTHLDRAMRRHQARSRAQLVSRFSAENR